MKKETEQKKKMAINIASLIDSNNNNNKTIEIPNQRIIQKDL
jgi:hypothetical protein